MRELPSFLPFLPSMTRIAGAVHFSTPLQPPRLRSLAFELFASSAFRLLKSPTRSALPRVLRCADPTGMPYSHLIRSRGLLIAFSTSAAMAWGRVMQRGRALRCVLHSMLTRKGYFNFLLQKVVQGALDAFLGNTEAGQKEESKYFVYMYNNSVVRLDVKVSKSTIALGFSLVLSRTLQLYRWNFTGKVRSLTFYCLAVTHR